jgi:hypothetical protein
MTGKSEFGISPSGRRSFVRRFLSNQWEILLFLVISTLLLLQVYLFYVDIHSLSDLHGAIAVFADFDSFIVHRLTHVAAPAIFLTSLLPALFPNGMGLDLLAIRRDITRQRETAIQVGSRSRAPKEHRLFCRILFDYFLCIH